MNPICEACGKELGPGPMPERCPHCGCELNGVPTAPMPSTATSTVELHIPTVSAVEPDDREYLEEGVMVPPKRPGLKGHVGRFEIVETLGKGAMGQVYLAREPMTETLVALKLLVPDLRDNATVVKYFLAEAKHMYSMSHPNILKVMEVSNSEEGPFFVMPYLTGGNLRNRITRGQGMSAEDILPLARQMAKGIAYAHERGIIHRDLKPDNILLDEKGRAKVADFGLVRTVFNDSVLDVSKKTSLGTPAYMSPGVANGLAEDTRCDIYAFGAILYEMLTGSTPYTGSTVDEVVQAVRANPPLPIHKLVPHADKGLTLIAEGAMERELRDRYATMEDVLADLERLRHGQKPIGPHATARRNRLPLLIGLGSACAALAGFLAITFWPETEADLALAPTPSPLPTQHPTSTPEPSDLIAAGRTFLDQGKTLEARIEFDKALRRNPNDVDALVAFADAFKAELRPRLETQYLLRASKLDPKRSELHQRIIVLLLRIGHTQPARNTFNAWKYHLPEDPELPEWEAKIAAKEKELQENPALQRSIRPAPPPPLRQSPPPLPPAAQQSTEEESNV